MEGRLLKRALLKPQERIAFEERLFRAFPGSEWITHPEVDALPTGTGDPSTSASLALTSAIGVIGGAKFDEAELIKWLRSLPGDSLLVTTSPRLKKDGDPYKGDFGGELSKRALEFGIRVDFVSQREASYGTYAKRVQLGTVIAATSGPVVLVGKGGDPDSIRSIAAGDWAMAKAILQGREVVEIA